MQGLIPRPELAGVLQQHCIALASDCDDPEDAVIELVEHIEDAAMLPFVVFADAQGRYLAGHSGAQTPAMLKALLERALSAP